MAEAYARALYESRFLKWRRDALKYIVLFSDAPAHAPEFYSVDYGVDPSRDNIGLRPPEDTKDAI